MGSMQVDPLILPSLALLTPQCTCRFLSGNYIHPSNPPKWRHLSLPTCRTTSTSP
jgi:hypothetical protein